ncbi:MAG: hypothetical protein K2I95_00365, partial [Treponemataceae bacterium]|nr:hypothetical protein [Treponemataceae bacterium]
MDNANVGNATISFCAFQIRIYFNESTNYGAFATKFPAERRCSLLREITEMKSMSKGCRMALLWFGAGV